MIFVMLGVRTHSGETYAFKLREFHTDVRSLLDYFAPAFRFSGKSGGDGVDGDAPSAHHVWGYLDRFAVFLQLGGDAGDEAAGAGGARESLSGSHVAGDGMVSLVLAGDGVGGDGLFPPLSFDGRAQRGKSGADWAMVRMVAAGLDCGVRVYLRVAASGEGHSR